MQYLDLTILIFLFLFILILIFSFYSPSSNPVTYTNNIPITQDCYPLSEVVTYNQDEPISFDCNTFRVGMHVNIDPEAGFAFTEGNCLRGYDVAVSQLIAQQLGKRLVIVDIPFFQLIEALQAGKIDMIAAQMNETTYRQRRIAQIPYLPDEGTTYSIAMTTTTFNQIQGTEDYIAALNQEGQSGIAVPPGTVQENYLLTLKRDGQIPNLSIVLVETTEEAIVLLKSGYVAGYLTDSPIGRDDPEITNVDTPITIPEEQIGPFALGVNIQCCSMIQRVTQITQQLEQNGTLQQLASQYTDSTEGFPLTIRQPKCEDPTRRCVSCF